METFYRIVGHHSDEGLHDILHEMDRAGRVVHLQVPSAELGRRRFKAVDQHGVEYGVALGRDEQLRGGSVLFLSEDRAVVVDALATEQLLLRATTTEGGIQLGWHAGHLHWRVRMEEDHVTVLLDAPRQDYLDRIADWISRGLIEVVE